MITVTAIWAFAKPKAKKIAIQLISDWLKARGKEYITSSKTNFTKELENIIYETVNEFDSLYQIPDEGNKFAFYKSDVLLQCLLGVKFIGRDSYNIDELKKQVEKNPLIITPRPEELFRFLELFENKCNSNDSLRKYQLNDNYNEAVFEILNVVDSIQSILNKIINEIGTTLTNEYISQLEEIKQNIESFKPKTALQRLEGLENRIRQKNLLTEEIESRLLFLKGKCKIEIEDKADGYELIVRAYIKNGNNVIKGDVVIAYLNLKEVAKAITLAQELIQENPYDSTGWLISAFFGNADIKEIWLKIPQVVKEKRGFVLNAISIINIRHQDNTTLWQELGLKLPPLTDEIISYNTLPLWEQTINAKLNLYFSGAKHYSIDNGGRLIITNPIEVKDLVEDLARVFNTINNTEIRDKYPLLRFYFSFLRSLLNDKNFDKDEFYNDYLLLKDSVLSINVHYAQFLANEDCLEDAIKVLNDSKFAEEELILLSQIIYSKILGKDSAVTLLKTHISKIAIVEFGDVFNLSNLFKLFLPNIDELKEQYRITLDTKTFASEGIKELFRITIEMTYFQEKNNKEATPQQLVELSLHFKDDEDAIFYLAQLLYSIEAFKECASMLQPLIVPKKQTQLNLLYCRSCVKGNIDKKGLLNFLLEIRVNNENNVYDFLGIENDLRAAINDGDNIVDIAWRGVAQYHSVETFHQNLLIFLERKGGYEEVQKYLNKYFKRDYKSENVGVIVSHTLDKMGFHTDAADLLFRLASNPSNSVARLNYMTNNSFPSNFIIDYTIVEKGAYVKLIGRNRQVKLISTEDDKYSIIGKNLNDVVMIPAKMGSGFHEYRVGRIMNAHLFLFEQILQEAHDPNSELQAEAYDFSDNDGLFDKNKFESTLINRFRAESSSENERKKNALDSYNNGGLSFTEVCMQVFSNNLMECYLSLTSQRFFTLPTIFNSQLAYSEEEIYVLDFTSISALANFQKLYGIKYNTKFLISNYLVPLLKRELEELQKFSGPKISFKVIDDNIHAVNYPEGYTTELITKYEELFLFIKENCKEKIIEERVEFSEVFMQKVNDSLFWNVSIDSAFFSTTLRYTLVSSDTFVLTSFKDSNPKQISPELFLKRFFKEQYQDEITAFFINENYIGVSLTHKVLLDEYRKNLASQSNRFNICISNLKFKWNASSGNISEAILFLKEMYLSVITSDAEKDIVTQAVFGNLLDGTYNYPTVVNLIRIWLFKEFKLTGTYWDRVNHLFDLSLNIARSPDQKPRPL